MAACLAENWAGLKVGWKEYLTAEKKAASMAEHWVETKAACLVAHWASQSAV